MQHAAVCAFQMFNFGYDYRERHTTKAVGIVAVFR